MEPEREKFRAYVEQSGLMSALTNVLVTLYEEPNKPKDALNFMMEALGSKTVDLKKMEMLENKCKSLEKENHELKEQVAKLLKKSEDPTTPSTTENSPEKEEET